MQGGLVPDDRRHEEQQLHQADQQRADVAVPGGQDAETQRHPDAVEHDQHQSRDDRRSAHDHGFGKIIAMTTKMIDVVGEEDHLPPHQPVDVHAQRRRKLLDQALIGDEHVGAFEDRRVDEVPDDQAERDVGQVLREWKLEQLGVQQPHRHRGGARRDGDPERPQHRAPVALLDVLPAQVEPQLALAEPSTRSRQARCKVLDCAAASVNVTCRPPEPFPTAHAPQPNPLAQPGGSRRDTRKYQPNRNHSCGSSLRMPGCDNRYPRLR